MVRMGEREVSMAQELEERQQPFEQLIQDFEIAEKEYDIKKKELISKLFTSSLVRCSQAL